MRDRIHCGAQVRTVKAFCLDISYFLMAWLLSVRDLMTCCYEKSDMVVLSQTHNEVCFVGISVQQRSQFFPLAFHYKVGQPQDGERIWSQSCCSHTYYQRMASSLGISKILTHISYSFLKCGRGIFILPSLQCNLVFQTGLRIGKYQ